MSASACLGALAVSSWPMQIRILILALSLPAFSIALCPKYDIKNNVIVFGGAGSTTPQMESCYPQYLTYSNDEGGQHVKCLAEQIEKTATSPDRPFVIAGHSSGAAHAQMLVQALSKSARQKARLILLEGFAIQQNQGLPTSCWYGKHGSAEGMNAGSMKVLKACTDVHVYEDKRTLGACTNALCLHIALVNKAVLATVVDRKTALTTGLANCAGNGNTEWLEPDPRALLTAKSDGKSEWQPQHSAR